MLVHREREGERENEKEVRADHGLANSRPGHGPGLCLAGLIGLAAQPGGGEVARDHGKRGDGELVGKR